MTDENGSVAECCADEDNLVEQPTNREDLTILVCEKCGRRHFEVVLEPGDMRAEPAS